MVDDWSGVVGAAVVFEHLVGSVRFVVVVEIVELNVVGIYFVVSLADSL